MLPLTSAHLREPEMALAHTPVLLSELLDVLRPAAGEVAVDCTFGAGGHAEAVAAALGDTGRLIAIDRDPSVDEYFRDVAAAAPAPASSTTARSATSWPASPTARPT